MATYRRLVKGRCFIKLGYSFMVRMERLMVSNGMVRNLTIFFWHSSENSVSFCFSHNRQQLFKIALTCSLFWG